MMPRGSLKIDPELDAELDEVCEDRDAPKGWIVKVLLRFAIPRFDQAIDEWKHAGGERAARRKRAAPKR